MSDESVTTEVTTTETAATTESTEPASNTMFSPDSAETTEATETAEVKTEGAPDEYGEFELPPDTEVLPEVLDKFKLLAKDFNLTQEKAQDLLKRYASEIAPVMANKAQEAWTQDVQARQAEIFKDPEIGGDKLKETKTVINRVCNTFLKPDEFKALSDQMARFGDNAPLLKLLVRIGKSIAEDTVVNSNSQGTGQKTEQDKLNELYPSMKQ